LTESTEDEPTTDIIEDIAALARKLAEKEPCKSASGPEALRAFATHHDEIATRKDPTHAPNVNVAVRRSRRKG
jgi:hypothetical protein